MLLIAYGTSAICLLLGVVLLLISILGSYEPRRPTYSLEEEFERYKIKYLSDNGAIRMDE